MIETTWWKQDSTQPHHFEGVPVTYMALSYGWQMIYGNLCSVTATLKLICESYHILHFHHVIILQFILRSWKCSLDGIKLWHGLNATKSQYLPSPTKKKMGGKFIQKKLSFFVLFTVVLYFRTHEWTYYSYKFLYVKIKLLLSSP